MLLFDGVEEDDPRPWLPSSIRRESPGWKRRVAWFLTERAAGRHVTRPMQWVTSLGNPRCVACGVALRLHGDGVIDVAGIVELGACKHHRAAIEAEALVVLDEATS